MSKLYTSKEIAKILNVHYGKVNNWIYMGKLKVQQKGSFRGRGKKSLISEEDLNEFIESRPNYKRFVQLTKPDVVTIPVETKTDVGDILYLYVSCLKMKQELDKMIEKIQKLL